MPMNRFGAHAFILLVHDYVTRVAIKFAHPFYVTRVIHHPLRCEMNDTIRRVVLVRHCCLMLCKGRMIYKGF